MFPEAESTRVSIPETLASSVFEFGLLRLNMQAMSCRETRRLLWLLRNKKGSMWILNCTHGVWEKLKASVRRASCPALFGPPEQAEVERPVRGPGVLPRDLRSSRHPCALHPPPSPVLFSNLLLTCFSNLLQGIPTLVLLDGKTGELISKDGRNIISSDAEGASFP